MPSGRLSSPASRRPPDHHPLGCHRPTKSDRDCFEVMLVRLVTGCSWEDAERLAGGWSLTPPPRHGATNGSRRGSSTPSPRGRGWLRQDRRARPRARSPSTARCTKPQLAGKEPGKSPVDRGKLGWKWSIATDAVGHPHRLDASGPPTATTPPPRPHPRRASPATASSPTSDTLRLDRGYDTLGRPTAPAGWATSGSPTSESPRTARASNPAAPTKVPLGLRWPVERTNSWLSNYGQMRRNTDRLCATGSAQLALAIALIIDRQAHRLAESLVARICAYPLTL